MKYTLISLWLALALVTAWCAMFVVWHQQAQIDTLREKVRTHELNMFSLQERLAVFEEVRVEIKLVDMLVERHVIGVRELKEAKP